MPGYMLAASVLSANFGMMQAEITDLASAGVDLIHLDVMDGSFVPPITFGESIVAVTHKACMLPCESHLMVINPRDKIQSFVAAGSSRVVIHVEASKNLAADLAAITAAGAEAGVAINPESMDSCLDSVLELVKIVTVMTVNPGWGGQPLIPECLKKVERIRDKLSRRNLDDSCLLEVDGGVNLDNIKQCAAAGANVFVVGSALVKARSRGEYVKQLHAAIAS